MTQRGEQQFTDERETAIQVNKTERRLERGSTHYNSRRDTAAPATWRNLTHATFPGGARTSDGRSYQGPTGNTQADSPGGTGIIVGRSGRGRTGTCYRDAYRDRTHTRGTRGIDTDLDKATIDETEQATR